MDHDIHVTGHAFRIRPVCDEDADFIVTLRTTPALSRYINPGAQTVEAQLSWLDSYYKRAGDYYFVLERQSNGLSEGLISIYDQTPDGESAEWGRWVIQPSSFGATESALLIYRCAFEHLGLERIYCRTLAENSKTVSFHDTCGLSSRGELQSYVHLGGQAHDAIEHTLYRSEWPAVLMRLERRARFIAEKLA
jgi:RimJ/RimL family protein N-acetyltransferase